MNEMKRPSDLFPSLCIFALKMKLFLLKHQESIEVIRPVLIIASISATFLFFHNVAYSGMNKMLLYLKSKVFQGKTKEALELSSVSFVYAGVMRHGAESGTRTRTPNRTGDFKSPASAIPPFQHLASIIHKIEGKVKMCPHFIRPSAPIRRFPGRNRFR